jgi:uncharacterized protein (DUF2062 family)
MSWRERFEPQGKDMEGNLAAVGTLASGTLSLAPPPSNSASAHSIALGFAAGVFISFTPLVGFHLLLAAIAAFFLRGSIVASAVGTVIGNPLTFPFIWFGTYNLGAALLALPGEQPKSELEIGALENTLISEDALGLFEGLKTSLAPVFWPMMAGSVPLGVVAGVACYCLVYCSTKAFQKKREAIKTNGA